ncbi:MAG TPA: hypothetical protein VJ570_04990 [Holophagaceae bacterium]|nr:hypothetical protein [Holophagaceae bacterium]
MSKFERLALHLGAWLTGISGLGYGWLRYFKVVQGEFGPEPHPLQGVLQHAHVLAAPLLLFALGMMVRGHFAVKLRVPSREGRRTGWGLALLILPMVAAGYGVQVVTDPRWRTGLAWVHGIASCLFLVAYLGHGLRFWWQARRGEAAAAPPVAAGWE